MYKLICILSLLWCISSLYNNNNKLIRRSKQTHHYAIGQKTKEMFHKLDQSLENQVGGAGGQSNLIGLERLDMFWSDLKNGGWSKPGFKVVYDDNVNIDYIESDTAKQFDVVVSGGTLGIFYAAVFQKAGYNTCVIERGKIAGRSQEWNISRKELKVLVKLGLLREEELESIIGIEFNPVRVGFKTDTSPDTKDPGFEVYVNDILNLGIKPDKLISIVKEKYVKEMGGTVLENIGLSKVDLYKNTALLTLSTGPQDVNTKNIRAKIVIDCMGNGSPISKQIRGPVEPDGICIVVGGCARGFQAENNTYSDVIYTDTPITKKSSSELQYFWEAFPSGSGSTDRTTYLFTYMDAKKERPSISEIMEDYWTLLPRYQGVNVDDLNFQRILYGCFPTYRNSPLQTIFPRVLQVGDASGIQSPLSFGGFGSLTRHIERIKNAVSEAIDNDFLEADDLARINPYQPNLSACWMFQRAMSVQVNQSPNPQLIVGTLSNSFSAMTRLGDAVMRPFLQDVLQFIPLLRTLTLAAGQDLLTPLKIVPQVGLTAMGNFFYHFIALGYYTFLANFIGPIAKSIAESGSLDAKSTFQLNRSIEAWKFGSGLDYYDHE